jgi:hypothetical protein
VDYTFKNAKKNQSKSQISTYTLNHTHILTISTTTVQNLPSIVKFPALKFTNTSCANPIQNQTFINKSNINSHQPIAYGKNMTQVKAMFTQIEKPLERDNNFLLTYLYPLTAIYM